MKVREGNFLIDQIFKNKSTKGQLISKADWRIIDSPKKKRTDKFVLFALLHGKHIKFVRSFFWRIYGAPICFLVLSDLHQIQISKKVLNE